MSWNLFGVHQYMWLFRFWGAGLICRICMPRPFSPKKQTNRVSSAQKNCHAHQILSNMNYDAVCLSFNFLYTNRVLKQNHVVFCFNNFSGIMWEMVFCYKNCSDLLWEKFVLVIEKNFWNSRLKAENFQIFEIIRTLYSNSERSEQFLVTECFFNLFLEVSHN